MRITTILIFGFCCFCIAGCKKAGNREARPSGTTDGKATYHSGSAADWIRALKSPDPNSRLNAIEALWRIYPWGPPHRGVSKDLVASLQEALDDPVADVRFKAWDILRGFAVEEVLTEEELASVLNQQEAVEKMHLPTDERSYYPMLLSETYGTLPLSHPVYSIARFEAATYLGRKAGSKTPSTITVLERLKSDKDPAVRFHSAVALWKITPGSSSPVGLLEKSLKSEDEEVRFWAAHALVEAVGRKAQAAVPTLLDCVADPNCYYEKYATVGLLQFGPDIMPAYLEKLRLPFDNSADWVYGILDMTLGDELAGEYLAVGLKDPRPAVQLKALDLLYLFSEEAGKFLPAIVQLTEDEDPNVRWQALFVFHSACSDDEAEVPVLARAFGGKGLRERTYAARALGECLLFGAAGAAPILFEGLKDPNESVREAVCEALAAALRTR